MIMEAGIQNISQILDTYWVGKLGSSALAAVTISVTILWVLNSLANGLGIGGMAVIARRIGEKNRKAADHALGQTILLGIGVSFLITLIGIPLAHPMLTRLGADEQVLPLGLAFLHITLWGLFTIVLVFTINAMLRGAGEARLAMKVLFLCTGVTVVLEPFLIFGLGPLPGLGIAGSALATVLGFGSGLVYQFIVLLQRKTKIAIDLHHFRIDLPLIWRIIRIALPSTTQMILRSSSRLVIIGIIGGFSTYALAGFGIANRMLLIFLIPSFGLANAAGTLVGQNLGANKPARAEKTAWLISAYGIGYMTVSALFLYIFAPGIIRIFDATPAVVEIGASCLRIVAPTMIISVMGVVIERGFDGAGDTVPAMIVNLLTLWGVEILLSYGLAYWAGWGVTGVWWGRAAANLADGALLAFWFKLGKWKKRQV